jgi:integrase
MLREDNVRQGFLDNAQFQSLRDALPVELRDPVTFLYLSGWRSGEMKTLEWRDVDLHNQMISLRPENSKNRQGRKLPLTGELLEVLKRAHSRRRLGLSRVFHRDGKPIGEFRKAFQTAAKAAGLNGHYVPYDLRRCGVRNLTRAGISTNVAMALTGHKTASVFRRYDIVDENDLRTAFEKRDTHLAASATI